MSALTLKVALELTARALSIGRQINAAPLTVAVLDSGGHLLALQREDGASLLRPSIAIGKAWGAIALGKGSRLLALDAQQRPAFFAALNGMGQSDVVPAPGGVLIRNEAGQVIGAVGISGDTSDIDEQCAISAIEVLGLRADAGVAVRPQAFAVCGSWLVRFRRYGVPVEPRRYHREQARSHRFCAGLQSGVQPLSTNRMMVCVAAS